jgi:hypothetical protein
VVATDGVDGLATVAEWSGALEETNKKPPCSIQTALAMESDMNLRLNRTVW